MKFWPVLSSHIYKKLFCMPCCVFSCSLHCCYEPGDSIQWSGGFWFLCCCLSPGVTLGQWSLCDHPAQNPQWFELETFSLWTFIHYLEVIFTLFLVPVGREDLLQKAVQTELAAVTCSPEKCDLKLLNCPLHICVKLMLFRRSRSCLTMPELMPVCQCIFSWKKCGFVRLELSWGWFSPLCTD